jgi:large subunit ribosomal protein L4
VAAPNPSTRRRRPEDAAPASPAGPIKAPLLDGAGKRSKDVSLEAAVFGAELKPHLVHEAVRAEANARRAGTRGAKSRGLVSGGRAKPWRQKGTGRARAGTTRAAQFTGGGVVFPPTMRSFDVKVNRKALRSALRGALSTHAQAGTLALLDGSAFAEPSTKAAAALLAAWGNDTPVVVVATEEEEAVWKSFRNLERVLVCVPSELEISAVVWARALLVSEAALPVVQGRAG